MVNIERIKGSNTYGIELCRTIIKENGEMLFDLDGTVVCNGNYFDYGTYGNLEVPPTTIHALRVARDQGIDLSVITGKTLPKAVPLFNAMSEIAYEGEVVRPLFNRPSKLEEGGVLWDPYSQEAVIQVPELDLLLIQEVRKAVQTQITADIGYFTHMNGETTRAQLAEIGMASFIVWDYGHEGADPQDVSIYPFIEAEYQALIDAVQAAHPELLGASVMARDIGGEGTFSFVSTQYDKSQSIQRLIEEGRSKPLNKIIFAGNGINDIPLARMIRDAGGAVICPGDADNELQDIAHIVAQTGAGYGVGEILEVLIKN